MCTATVRRHSEGGIQADPSRWPKMDRIAHPQASEVKRFFHFFFIFFSFFPNG
jgi:hypothetical protein